MKDPYYPIFGIILASIVLRQAMTGVAYLVGPAGSLKTVDRGDKPKLYWLLVISEGVLAVIFLGAMFK